MFGVINALFSGFAFAGIIFTIWLQREELKLQREELKLIRTELTRTASAQEASEKALSDQAETLQTTAQINAITTLLDVYQKQLNVANKGGSRPGTADELRAAIKKTQIKLELLLEGLENKQSCYPV